MDIGFETEAGQVVALGDQMLAAEMISNLLDNAIRYNRADGAVTVRVFARDEAAVVEVEDEGPGIDPADREKVWERFYRTPAADSPPGSGLGLPIVRALGERMDAHVSLGDGTGGKGIKAVVLFRGPETQPNGSTDAEFRQSALRMTAC
jgi:two-component system sensor histidine kinase TctE